MWPGVPSIKFRPELKGHAADSLLLYPYSVLFPKPKSTRYRKHINVLVMQSQAHAEGPEYDKACVEYKYGWTFASGSSSRWSLRIHFPFHSLLLTVPFPFTSLVIDINICQYGPNPRCFICFSCAACRLLHWRRQRTCPGQSLAFTLRA